MAAEQITWVGQQWLMKGYCGRAVVSGGADEAKVVRPVVMLSRRGKMRRGARRIGPTIDGAAAPQGPDARAA